MGILPLGIVRSKSTDLQTPCQAFCRGFFDEEGERGVAAEEVGTPEMVVEQGPRAWKQALF